MTKDESLKELTVKIAKLTIARPVETREGLQVITNPKADTVICKKIAVFRAEAMRLRFPTEGR
jgi:hypothetical protein